MADADVLTLGVVSDTHLYKRAKRIPRQLIEGLTGVHLILHAGDLVDAAVLRELGAIAPVVAVLGNNDPPELEAAGLPWRRVVEVGEVRIGLTHGHLGASRSTPTPERAWRAFAEEDVQAVVFGHSHIPYHEVRAGRLLFNPGSPTDRRRAAEFSFGLLFVRGREVTARHVFFPPGS